MSVFVNKIIEKSGVNFGTSGARGLVSNFSNEVCAAFTFAFVKSMKKNFSFNEISIAMDNRPSSPKIASAICGAAKEMKLEVNFYGVIPTPALALQSMSDKVPAIMVTGSHIPFDRNGIKFYRPDGEITKADEVAILGCSQPMLTFKPFLPGVSNRAEENYIRRYVDCFGSKSLSGMKVGIYEHSSAGRDIYHSLFKQMGAEVISLGRSNDFIPIDTEAVADIDREKAKKWSNEYSFDAIFSTDGDGDRPLISDEKGLWLRGDIVGLLTAKFLGVEALAVPVSCNTAIEKEGFFKRVLRTRIGSPYVIDAFTKIGIDYSSIAGFEANGGFLLGTDLILNKKLLKALPTRDALLPVIVLLAKAVKEQKPLSFFVAELPSRYTASDRIQGVEADISQGLIAKAEKDIQILLDLIGMEGRQVENVNQVDGLRMVLDDGSIVHLRPSGNAPELRCYAEADNQKKADQLVEECLKAISVFVNV